MPLVRALDFRPTLNAGICSINTLCTIHVLPGTIILYDTIRYLIRLHLGDGNYESKKIVNEDRKILSEVVSQGLRGI